MNRIEICYKKHTTTHHPFLENKKIKTSVLFVYDDLKGVCCVPILRLYGKEADLMYNLLQCVDWKKAEKFDMMSYGGYEPSNEITEAQFNKCYSNLYGSMSKYSTW